MKKLLISTLGTNKNIFESLRYVVEQYSITKAVYLASKEKEVLRNLELIKNYNQKAQIETKEIYFNDVENVNKIIKNLEESFIKKEIEQVRKQGWKVYLDYTYGTKALSSGCFFYFLSNKLVDELIYVSGPRGKNGVVVGNPTPITLQTTRFFLPINLNQLKENIRQFRFDEALTNLNSLGIEEWRKNLYPLIQHFDKLIKGKLDIFEQEKIDKLKQWQSIKIDFKGLDRNNHLIEEYKQHRQKVEKSKNTSEKILIFEFGYLSDLAKIRLARNEPAEGLALFVSALDKYLTIKLLKQKLTDSDTYFSFEKNNFLFKKGSLGKNDKEPPTGVSWKLEKIQADKKKKDELTELIQKRNESIFGHGFYFPKEEIRDKIINLLNYFAKDLKIILYKNYFLYYPIDFELESITI
jgi:hypothetical protein